MRPLITTAASLMLLSPCESQAQAYVGHQRQQTAGWSHGSSSSQTIRQRWIRGVSGFNVSPDGEDETFSQRGRWEIRQQGAPFSLEITEVNPEITVEQSTTKSTSSYVQNKNTATSLVTGRLAEQFPRAQQLYGERLTVFDEP